MARCSARCGRGWASGPGWCGARIATTIWGWRWRIRWRRWQAGARQVECAVNGIGERAGNAALEEIAVALAVRRDHYQAETRLKLNELCATSRMLSEITRVPVPPNKAVVGANAFAHEAGIHQDGILKNPLTYQVISPEAVGVARTGWCWASIPGRNALRSRLAELGVIAYRRRTGALLPLGDGAGGHEERRQRCRHAAPGARSARRMPGCRYAAWLRYDRGMSQKPGHIAVLPGDGIGPEVVRAAVSVLQDCAGEFGFRCEPGRVSLWRNRHRSHAASRCRRRRWTGA